MLFIPQLKLEVQTLHSSEFQGDTFSEPHDDERTVSGIFPYPDDLASHPKAQTYLSPPAEDERGPVGDGPAPTCFALLPSDPLLRRSPPFPLSNPTEYVDILRGLREDGRSNSEGMVLETFSGFTFLLHITCPDNSGEIAVKLVAVFEGDALSLSGS